MPPRGATASKVGQRYEDRWAAHTILKLLRGDAESIYLERIDTDETGFEFEIAADGVIELRAGMGKHIRPRIRDRRLRDITPKVVDRFRAEVVQDGVGSNTARRALVILQGILTLAIAEEEIPDNPVAKIRKPTQSRRGSVFRSQC